MQLSSPPLLQGGCNQSTGALASQEACCRAIMRGVVSGYTMWHRAHAMRKKVLCCGAGEQMFHPTPGTHIHPTTHPGSKAAWVRSELQQAGPEKG